MSNEGRLVEVGVTAKFKRNVRVLGKKYRSILNDIQPIIEQLECGYLPGVQVAGLGYTIFKVRVKNSDVQKGKSGGYRVIYYVKTEVKVILVTIYSKSDQEDVAAEEIMEILAEFEEEHR